VRRSDIAQGTSIDVCYKETQKGDGRKREESKKASRRAVCSTSVNVPQDELAEALVCLISGKRTSVT
jgi:hypothetical protein